LVLIVSASRSGSSWLASVLAGSTGMASLRGELDPLLLVGLRPEGPTGPTHDSDVLGPGDLPAAAARRLSLCLSASSGSFLPDWDGSPLSARERYELAMQTVLQWPTLDLDDAALLGAIRDAVATAGHPPSPDRVTLNLVGRLKEGRADRISPYYYDVDY